MQQTEPRQAENMGEKWATRLVVKSISYWLFCYGAYSRRLGSSEISQISKLLYDELLSRRRMLRGEMKI